MSYWFVCATQRKGTGMRSDSSIVNGATLKRLRQTAGWTQAELAEFAECSEKTIRNAESEKEKISSKVIDAIAAAFELYKGIHVQSETLKMFPERLARHYCDALAKLEGDAYKEIKKVLSDNFVHVVPGDFEFSGEYHGEEFHQCLKSFYSTFERPDKNLWQPHYETGIDTVVCWGREVIRLKGQLDVKPVSSILVIRFAFEGGMISRTESTFDVEATQEYCEEHGFD